LYVTKGETLFITCDNEKQSTSHAIEGVGILSLNETCKAYATRDILIPGEQQSQDEYQDFIPKSTITGADQLLSNPADKNIMETKHIKNNEISDLNNIAKSMGQIEESNNINEIKRNQTRSNYVLYATTAITVTAILIYTTYGIHMAVKKLIQICHKRRRTQRKEGNKYAMPTYPQMTTQANEQQGLVELMGVDIADQRTMESLPIQYPRIN
jgi:hypothetical protein